MTYNITQLQGAETTADLFQIANVASNNILAGMIIIVLFFITLIISIRYRIENALLVASWVGFISSVFFVYMDLLNFIFIMVFLSLIALNFLWTIIAKP